MLVPSRAAIFDLDTLSTTLDLVRMGQKEAAVVLNAVPHRGSDAQEAKAVIAAYGANIAPPSAWDIELHFNIQRLWG